MKKVSYYLFSHKALFTFVKEVLSIIIPSDNNAFGLTGFLNQVTQHFNDFDTALSRDYVDPYTTKINEADRERDLRFLGLKHYVDACSYRKNEKWQEAAQNIANTIERYGDDLYRIAQPEESAALVNLLSDLQAEPLSTNCNTIQLSPWINELVDAQSLYESVVKQRHQQEESDGKTLMVTRKPLIASCRNLLKMVELQQQAQSSDALNAMVTQLNNLIATSMASARLSNSLSDKANIEN